MCEKMQEKGLTLRTLLKDVIYTLKTQEGGKTKEYQGVLVDDLFEKLETVLKDTTISGSQEL